MIRTSRHLGTVEQVDTDLGYQVRVIDRTTRQAPKGGVGRHPNEQGPAPVRRTARPFGPEKQLLLIVNRDEGPLTSIDRQTLRSMGETPWDERPGHDGQSYAEAHDVTDRLLAQHDRRVTAPVAEAGMTEPQQSLIENRLLVELQRVNLDVYAIASEWYATERDAGRMTKARATEVIGRLKKHCGYEEKGWNKRADFVAPAPKIATPTDYFEDIPDGYYALERDGHTSFFRVSTYKRLLSGQTRANRKVQTQASDNLYPMSQASGRTILEEIRKAKPFDAAMRYAREIGNCCKCGRTLTDDESRERGMGPTCASKGF